MVDWRELAEQAMRVRAELAGLDDRQVDELIQRAMQSRPELTDLTEQARSLDAQADVTRAAVRPQVGFAGAFAYIGSNALVTQGYGAAALYVDWTILDGKGSRRRAESLRRKTAPRSCSATIRRLTSRSRSAPAGSTSSRPARA